MNDAPEANAPPLKFDPTRFVVDRPLATPEDLGVAFGQLIDAICDLTSISVGRVITAGLSSITISWLRSSIPSEEWLTGVEEQLRGFAACNGVHVIFRRH